ncbi:TonB-dependent receptor [Alkalicaulis satelles]|uniref:TonB-dependent receptor n=2 Tax=Alkalicaulis satelles TaxID=2609175 RepID=A0A5M6ZBP2_9PROT|nr:TonB-dependent receptor [Alkalicaulis satelles]
MTRVAILLAAVSPLGLGAPALAETAQAEQAEEGQAQSAQSVLRDVITITGTKRPGGVDVQEAPVAVTAYSGEQLDALQFQDLSSLSYIMPNVQLEDIGTAPGIANFTIRGIGINSSIPSVDPTVGVFIDGVYQGINAGLVFDNFDLEGIEVLRGPQGILFGRNVTGGAVLIRTTAPSEDPSLNARFGVETGPRYTASAVLNGPLAEGFSAKLAVYHSKDEGWFTNEFDGSSHGASRTWVVRPAVAWRPNDDFELIVRGQYSKNTGDGPAGQNHVNGAGIGGLFDRNSFRFSIDEPGEYSNTAYSVTAEANLRVDFGDGTITNIFGWRDVEGSSTSDIDATPGFLFHADASNLQDQWSNELRYAGVFNNVDVTTGVFYFDQTINYVERRRLLGGASVPIGGGYIDHMTWGAFAQFDIHTTDRLTINLGGRYSYERKRARIQALLPGAPCVVGSGCTVPTGGAGVFEDTDSWTSFAPKVGLQYDLGDDSQLYAFWTRGFRSGGYNLRNTDPTFAPGPYDQEQVDSFEAGMKSDFLDGALRVNAAAFWNEISDMQREVNLPSAATGVVQLIQNTADARIRGFEVEARAFLSENFIIHGQLGYLDGEYKRVLFDLNGDGVIDDADLALDIPRLAPWTYGVGAIYDTPLDNWGGANLTASVSYNFRDRNAYTDNNLGFFDSAGILDASVALGFHDGGTVLSFYGKNLTNEVTFGGDTQLPAMLGPVPLGGTFSPLNKGRVYGVELRFRR